MRISILSLLGQNITLLYESLDLRVVDINSLKQVVEGTAQPMVMDMPETIVAAFPAEPIVIQLGDQRIRITHAGPNQNIGSVPLWRFALRCHQLVRKPTLLAYGFNYDVLAALDAGDANELLRDLFVADTPSLETTLGGSLTSFTPRLRFDKAEARCDLVIEPVEALRLKVHLNVHYEYPGRVLPSQARMKSAFLEQFEYLSSVLPVLLEGGKL
jgi:hypothetical protein